MKIHLVDGTYELFRAFYGAPPAKGPAGNEVGAVRGLLRSLAALLQKPGVTHMGAAFDTVIESFRNHMFAGYKTGEGIDPALFSQFPLAEEGCRALGIATWSMIEYEADDALATAAAHFAADPAVEQVIIACPDKDLTQCVRGTRVVCMDRLKGDLILDEDAVKAKFGVAPESIPDYLALVGDTADGIPGIKRWGAKSAAAVLARYGHLEDIPDDERTWDVPVRGAASLAASLREGREAARLYRVLATLRTDVPMDLDGLEWKGADPALFPAFCEAIGERSLPGRITKWR